MQLVFSSQASSSIASRKQQGEENQTCAAKMCFYAGLADSELEVPRRHQDPKSTAKLIHTYRKLVQQSLHRIVSGSMQ